MRQAIPERNVGRAIIGMIALYALLLQAFFAHATPFAIHHATAAICAAYDGGGSSAPEKAARHDHACCTVNQLGALAPPPAELAHAGPLFPPDATLARRPEAAAPPTGPPTRSHSARGPPSA